MCLFDVKFPEDDLKDVETYRVISGLYMNVCFSTCAFVGIIY